MHADRHGWIMAAMVLTLATLAQAGGLHLRMERTYVDGADTKTADWSGSGNHGTLVNGPTLTAGRVGRGMQLVAASSQYVDVPHASSLVVSTTATWSVWINRAAHNRQAGLITKYTTASNQRGYQITESTESDDPTRVAFALSSDGVTFERVFSALDYIDDAVWIHLAVTFNAGDVRFYKNGKLHSQASTTRTSIFNNTGKSTEVGNYSLAARSFNGTIDEPIITPFAWTANEVRAYYHSGVVPSRRSE